MKLTSAIILCLFNFSLFAQNMVVGTVKDSETKKPIPYVNIGIVKKNIGTVSDSEGKFDLKFPLTLENDIIKLSSIGYKSKSMLVKHFSSNLKTNSIAYRGTSQAEWQKNGKIGVGFNYTVKY